MAYVLTPERTRESAGTPRAPRPEPRGPTGAPDLPPGSLPVDRLRRGLARGLRFFQRPLSPRELILFTSQLNIMLQTGTGMVESLEALESQTRNERLRRALRSVRVDITSGQMLSAAMSRNGGVFPETVVSMVAIGESGGFLEAMLDRITTMLEKEADLRATVRSAFTYPLVLAGFCVLVVAFMMTFILPRFVKIFADMGAALPLPTRVLLGTVRFLTHSWMWVLPAALALAGGTVASFRTRAGRRHLDAWLLAIPMVGPFNQNVVVSRLMRSLGELLNAGVPLLEALHVTRPLVGNVHYREMLRDVETSVTSGKTLSGPMGESGLVPPTVEQMIRTAESTGTLSRTMIRIADFYDGLIRTQAKTLTTLLEPMMIFVVGGIVGFVVLSLLLPIFRMSSLVH